MKKHLSEFYNYLTSNFPEIGKEPYNNRGNSDNNKKMILYFKSLPEKDFKTLISDRHWNSYPLYTCNYSGQRTINPRNYFNLISSSLRTMINVDPKLKATLIKNSEGIFRIATIRHTLGREKLKSAKVGLKSNDTRVRKLAVSLLPVSDLKGLINSETNSSVLGKISHRVGYLNMTKAEKSSNSRWRRSRGFLNDEFNQEELRELLDTIKAGGKIPYYERDLLEKVSYYVPVEELPFYIDVLNQVGNNPGSKQAKQNFITKITGRYDA